MTVSLLGILNITEDSFSDGSRFLDQAAALAHGRALAAGGADIIDLGAASSNPNAKRVPPELEIARLAPVVDALSADGIALSVDTFSSEVQRWALQRRVDFLNDVQGFPHPDIYPALADAACGLIVMHAVQEGPIPERVAVDPDTILDRVLAFFEARIAALTQAGVARERLILDPGMGLFLGTRVEASYRVLRQLGRIKEAFGLPVLVSVSRKSFLRKLTGKGPHDCAGATLAAELFAASRGADYIRTHDPAILKDALIVERALSGG